MAQDGLSTLSQPPQVDFSTTAGLQKGLTALQGQESTLAAERQKSLKPAIEKFESEMAKPKPDAPTPPESTQPPQAQLGKAGPEFFAAIAVFAGLASALSRRHATNALAAFSGGIQGLVQGNMLQFNENYKTWKAETEAAQLDFRNRLDAYDAAINNRKLAADDLKNELLLASIRYDDKAMQDAKDDIFKMLNIRDRENETAVRLQEVTQQIADAKFKADEQVREKLGLADLETFGKFQDQSKIEAGGTMVKGVVTGFDPTKYNQILKQKVEAAGGTLGGGANPALVDAIGTYRSAPLSAWAMARGEGKQLMNEVYRKYPDYDSKQYYAMNREEGDVYAGQLGRSIRFVNVAIQHLGVVQTLADALQNNDAQLLNRAKNEWRTQFGSELPTDLATVSQIVGQEVVKAVITGGGTGAERDQAQAQWAAIKSPEQLRGAVVSTRALLSGQMAGLRQQFTVGLGKTNDDFNKWLLPETRTQLNQPGFTLPSGTVLPGASGSTGTGGGGHKPGDIITVNGKQYRVLGGDPNDPDIEEVTQ